MTLGEPDLSVIAPENEEIQMARRTREESQEAPAQLRDALFAFSHRWAFLPKRGALRLIYEAAHEINLILIGRDRRDREIERLEGEVKLLKDLREVDVYEKEIDFLRKLIAKNGGETIRVALDVYDRWAK